MIKQRLIPKCRIGKNGFTPNIKKQQERVKALRAIGWTTEKGKFFRQSDLVEAHESDERSNQQ